jgi:DNA-binding NtrC family response regulator
MARIIVIDDEEDLRGLLRLLLESEGHEVDEAENGAKGLVALGEQAYDLVITDVLMPEEDGIAVAKEAPRLQPDAKVLAISGGGAVLPANWSLKVMKMFGVNAALHKPFEEDEFIRVVDELLAG